MFLFHKKKENKMNFNNLVIVGGSRNQELVKKIASKLYPAEIVIIDTAPWPNGQARCIRPVDTTFNDKVVFIVTSLQYKGYNSPIEELKLIYSCCKAAREIHIVISWFCGKDDVKHLSGQIPVAPFMANEIKSLEPKTILLHDLHQSSQTGYFYNRVSDVKHFYLLGKLIKIAQTRGVDQIAATDFSSSNRAGKVDGFLKTGHPIILASKMHDYLQTNAITSQLLLGEVVGKKIAFFDDMALSLKTLVGAAEVLRKIAPAVEIETYVVHFDPSEDAYERLKIALEEKVINNFFTTNTCEIEKRFQVIPCFNIIDVSDFIARAIELIVTGRSTKELFLDI